ncbi:hypothetical protein EWM64_g411 [Hericium alpestre]|uniref:Metallo-beta-lactamase domain-containing protein n=1 Tax=Hericium alpestre TaxID=135208 RepID=A0A4Z0A937_9AGAM|nr:hypothetical protein EWM64_g411 [Hericium alpestre]
MDVPTLRAIIESRVSAPHVFVALNNAEHISKSLSLPRARVHELDWWDERVVRVALPAAEEGADKVQTQMRFTCTPSQHVSSRSAFDRWASLWAAWVVEELLPPQAPAQRPPTPSHSSFTPTSGLWEMVGKKLYFAGDTGYRTVHDGEDEDKVPVCPAFAEVGERFGGVDVALLPIGAYGPRAMWSNLHASPGDAVRMMKDVKAKKALAMHWGTWVLTSEPVLEPPELLRKECAKAGIEDDEFLVPALGETVFF